MKELIKGLSLENQCELLGDVCVSNGCMINHSFVIGDKRVTVDVKFKKAKEKNWGTLKNEV